MKIVHLPKFMSVKKILIFSYLSALALNLNLGVFSSEEYFEDSQDESYINERFFLDNEDDETTLNQEFVTRTSPYTKTQTNSVPVQQSQNKPVTATINNSAQSANTESLNIGQIVYEGNTKYYFVAGGKEIVDRRKVGGIYPNLFDVVRKGQGYDYINNEDEDRGCNLEKMFLASIFPRFGFDTRRFLNALEVSNCESLGSAEEKSLCRNYKSSSACNGATPLVFESLPLAAGTNYLTYKKETPFKCEASISGILSETRIPKQSREWTKIESDLIENKRSTYTKSLKNTAPISQIKASKPGASQRDIDFAVNEWIFNKARDAQFQVSDAEILPVVEARYSPSSAIKNISSSRAEFAGGCTGAKEKRYQNKVYSEALNIPAHHSLSFADYVNINNGCICRK
jgi:hypothetical protein